MAKKKITMYQLVLDTIKEMEVGDSKTIKTPSNITNFRKYLNEISNRHGRKFTTRIVEDGKQLMIMRIKYSNLYSNEIE